MVGFDVFFLILIFDFPEAFPVPFFAASAAAEAANLTSALAAINSLIRYLG